MSDRLLGRVALLMMVSAASMWGADPMVGTWVLNAKKSVYKPGPAPKSQTRVYRENKDGIIATVVTVGVDGKATTVEYPQNYDGLTHPVAGSPDMDAIKMVQVTTQRSESTILHAGRPMATTVRMVSGDGKTLTITFNSTAENGDPIRNTQVYDRK
ncbi:MAG: hypothetical protein ABIR70_24640 [Bryobacteraceae bacterium]